MMTVLMMRSWLIAILCVLAQSCAVLATTNDVGLVQQLEQLRIENESLRKENQDLRKLVVEQHRKANPPKAKEPVPQQVDDVVEVLTGETGYWLSNGGTRHNKKCRYYKNSKGRPCRKEHGRPCKSCGG